MLILPALVTFLAAFLLFLVQPLIAKWVLPWFGGGAAVWTVCMLFFQCMLLAGYTYSHWISRIGSHQRQILVHGALLLVSMAFLPIVPSEALKPLPAEDPTIGLLVLMLATVGFPFFLLAASSPLIQFWFSRISPGRSVYRFYALSNVGSLSGLLIYPFLLQPLTGLYAQSWQWSSAYVLFVVVSIVYARVLFSRLPSGPTTAEQKAQEAVSPELTQRLLWLALPACGSLILLATTNRVTQDIAPVPVLWVLPLALYLVSFIISFDRARWYDRRIWIPLYAIAVTTAVWLLYADIFTDLRLQIAVLLFVMFVGCMICHGELFRLRPDPSHLTTFYLYVALGGALGGMFVAVGAPVLFSDLWEYQIGLVLPALILLVILARERPFWPPGALPAAGIPVLGLGTAVLGVVLIQNVRLEIENSIAMERNFYGVAGVYEFNKDARTWRRELWHGAVRHGGQLMWPKYRHHTTSYYGPSGGAGLSLRFHPAAGTSEGLKVGAVGLGVGTIAEYLTGKDLIRFYEIDPQIVELSNNYFSFLKQARANVEIVLGDARLSLARELHSGDGNSYDVLIIDAFNSDAVPVHLMTREAFELYWQHLKPDGILAVHTTAIHLNFEPLVRDLALVMGKRAVLVRDQGRERGAAHSVWVLLTNNEVFLRHESIRSHPATGKNSKPRRRAWTDDYSNILPYLKWDGT